VRIVDTSVPVVVLKLFSHCGVGIMRSLGRLGIPVYGVDADPWNPGLHSRYCRGKFIWDAEKAAPEETIRFLREVAQKVGGRPILISNGDVPSLFLADHAPELEDSFRIQTPAGELVRSLSDKKQMYFQAKKFGVPTAETVFPQSRRDVEEFLSGGSAHFPIMLKGINSALLQERTGLRMIIVHNREELLAQYDRLEDPADPNLMVQEYIPGEDDSVWMFNGYFNDQSDCLVGFTGRKLHQYPIYTGMTSLGICLSNEAVASPTKHFMKQIGYKGILDIGYRFDARDGQYKLLDINPRVGATFRLFVGSNGLDVIRALYLDLTGQPVPPSTLCEGRKWLVENNDLIAFRNYHKDGKLTFSGWIRSFRGVQECAWFATDDPVPFLLMGMDLTKYGLGWLAKALRLRAQSAPD
jgi:D-aspartate ligase